MLGSKVSNLLLAEKNIIDFVDKNLGQEKERLSLNNLELEPVCAHLVGGPLDFPSQISHDFCDITTAFDIYIDSFTKKTAAQIPPKFGSGIFKKSEARLERLSKMPFRGDELSERQFVNAVIGSGTKIRAHLLDSAEICVQEGRLENLYGIISNIVIIRNYIWLFIEIFELEPGSKLKSEYDEFCELVEVVSEQMLQCETNLLTTYILHDEISQNWESTNSYYEGMRSSPTIQTWAHFIKAMCREMWSIMPPKLSQRILGMILNDSLSIITSHYSKITPTAETTNQFVVDILNILGTVEEVLFNISENLDEVCGTVEPSTAKIIFSIHIKCHCLATSLILVGASLETLYKTLRRGLSTCSLLEREVKDEKVLKISKPVWGTVLSSLCPKYTQNLNYAEWELLSNLKLLCSQPSVSWPLLFKVLVMDECHLSSIILQLFPSICAPYSDFIFEGAGFKRCCRACCNSPTCHSLPKNVANQNIAPCLLYILAHSVPRELFREIYRPLIRGINEWSVMDKAQVWTMGKRPVWFSSLLQILLPILKTCVQGLVLSINANFDKDDENGSSSSSSSSNATNYVIETLNSLTEILSMIPRGFFLVCEEIDENVPPEIYPVRNNVPVHFLVNALYTLLNLGPQIVDSVIFSNNINSSGGDESIGGEESHEKKVRKERISALLLSISERLCHLDDTKIFDQVVHRLISQIESMMKQTQAQLEKKKEKGVGIDFIVTDNLAQLKANFLLDEIEGQISLRLSYWFLTSNYDMLEDIILKNSQNSPSQPQNNPTQPNYLTHFQNLEDVKVAPRIRTYYRMPNFNSVFHYVNKYRTFDEILWDMEKRVDWVRGIRDSRFGLHKSFIMKQFERRTEFRVPLPNENSEGEEERVIHLAKMVSEIRALLIT